MSGGSSIYWGGGGAGGGPAVNFGATGWVATCAAGPVCVGPNSIWPGSLGRQATWGRCFESSRRSSIPAAAQRRRGGNGDNSFFTPPGW
jgi:hypothetical protein